VLPKCFALLSSRARHGSFRTLHLDLACDDFGTLANWLYCGDEGEVWYDAMLVMLRHASRECNFQRCISVHSGDELMAGSNTIRDLHLAFGGKMICDEKLEWENYKRIGS